MSHITTHILDTSRGRPASGVRVELQQPNGENDGWQTLASATTDRDGRCSDLGPETLAGGTYRLRFEVAGYLPEPAFFPEVAVVFVVDPSQAHYHVPLLLNPYGYSTYRGS